VQVLLEPSCSELRYMFERPWFRKEMRDPRDDLQRFLTAELGIGDLVQVDHRGITATDNEQSGRDYVRQCCASQIGSPTACDHGANDVPKPGSSHERRPTSRTRAEVPNTQMPCLICISKPVSCIHQPRGEQLDVETQMTRLHIDSFFFWREQIEEQRA
jgi:hypothetical protein